nr:MAG TPA: hypothetical protein [Caudoviricetes sp.]
MLYRVCKTELFLMEGVAFVLRQPYFLGDGIYKVYTGVDIPYYGCAGAYLVIYVLLYI